MSAAVNRFTERVRSPRSEKSRSSRLTVCVWGQDCVPRARLGGPVGQGQVSVVCDDCLGRFRTDCGETLCCAPLQKSWKYSRRSPRGGPGLRGPRSGTLPCWTTCCAKWPVSVRFRFPGKNPPQSVPLYKRSAVFPVLSSSRFPRKSDLKGTPG